MPELCCVSYQQDAYAIAVGAELSADHVQLIGPEKIVDLHSNFDWLASQCSYVSMLAPVCACKCLPSIAEDTL